MNRLITITILFFLSICSVYSIEIGGGDLIIGADNISTNLTFTEGVNVDNIITDNNFIYLENLTYTNSAYFNSTTSSNTYGNLNISSPNESWDTQSLQYRFRLYDTTRLQYISGFNVDEFTAPNSYLYIWFDAVNDTNSWTFSKYGYYNRTFEFNSSISGLNYYQINTQIYYPEKSQEDVNTILWFGIAFIFIFITLGIAAGFGVPIPPWFLYLFVAGSIALVASLI